MNIKFLHNLPYILWLAFYYLFFSLLFGGSPASFTFFAVVYGISILVALTVGENIYRSKHGIRKIATREEYDLLMPIFQEVYQDAKKVDPTLSDNIQIFVLDTMDVNAFAFGRKTLVVTKGSIQLLNKKALYGMVAHEFGHFSSRDTVALILSGIGNMTLTLFARLIFFSLNILNSIGRNESKSFIIKLLGGIVKAVYTVVIVLGDIILLRVSRNSEYRADHFAFLCGYGVSLHYLLSELKTLDFSPSVKFRERVFSSHPPTEKRIERLEKLL